MASTSWLNPGTAIAMADLINGTEYRNAWDADRAKSQDGQYANIRIGADNRYENAPLRVVNFGTDAAIPTGATITGIEVKVRRWAYPPDAYVTAAADNLIRLVLHSGSHLYQVTMGTGTATGINDQRGSNLASSTLWPQSEAAIADAIYGGPTNLWGAGLTDAQIRSTAFGLDIKPSGGGKSDVSCFVDCIQVRIHYEGGAEPEPQPNPAVGNLTASLSGASMSAVSRAATKAVLNRSTATLTRTIATKAVTKAVLNRSLVAATGVSATKALSRSTLTATLPAATLNSTTTVQSGTIYPVHPTVLNIGSYAANYENARQGAGLVNGQFGWVGQYWNGGQYEINQVMLGFDLTGLPNKKITKAELRFNVNEAYGQNTIEARIHDWVDVTSFVPGNQLDTKPLLGSLGVNSNQTGNKAMALTGLPHGAFVKLVLAGADQRTGTPPVDDDTTLLIGTGATLYLEFSETEPAFTPAVGSLTADLPAATLSSASQALSAGALAGTAPEASLIGRAVATIRASLDQALAASGLTAASTVKATASISASLPVASAAITGQLTTKAGMAAVAHASTLNGASATVASGSLVASLPAAQLTATTVGTNSGVNANLPAAGLVAHTTAWVKSSLSAELPAATSVANADTDNQLGAVAHMPAAQLSATGRVFAQGGVSVALAPATLSASVKSPVTGSVSADAPKTSLIAYSKITATGGFAADLSPASLSASVASQAKGQVVSTTPALSISALSKSDSGVSLGALASPLQLDASATAAVSSDLVVQLPSAQLVAVTVGLVPITPTPERTIVIPAEDRVIRVAAESRLVVVEGEIRLVSVGPESRLITVPAEDRTVNTAAEKRLLVATS